MKRLPGYDASSPGEFFYVRFLPEIGTNNDFLIYVHNGNRELFQKSSPKNQHVLKSECQAKIFKQYGIIPHISE